MAQDNSEYLIRIVRLTLKPEKVEAFLTMFDAIKTKIRTFEGCEHLELLQDADYPNVVSTYSLWQDEKALLNYRNSAFFKEVWPRTKTMFAAPPTAFSSRQIRVVNLSENT